MNPRPNIKQRWRRWLPAALLCAVLPVAAAAATDAPGADFDVSEMWALKKNGGYAVQADLALKHTEPIEDLINGGYDAHFLIEIRFLKSRWYWDQIIGDITWNGSLSYDALLNRYVLKTGGNIRHYATLAAALHKVTHLRAQASDEPGFVRIFEQGDIYMQARFRLLIDHLPQPVQISLLLSNDWDITGPWKIFPLAIRRASE